MAKLEIKETKIDGCYEIINNPFVDFRGEFVKVFHYEDFCTLNLCNHFEENYFSVSRKNVFRGLHFQIPPYDNVKLATCLSGSIIDVVVDLRKSSKTYGEYYALELNDKNRKSLYVPEGLAHGFYANTDNAIFFSFNSKKYNQGSERGIRWDSFGFSLGEKEPLLSEKDQNLPLLKDFKSPF